MNLTGRFYTLELTLPELIDLIPEGVWKNDIEKVLLVQAKKEYGDDFKDIDYQDCEEGKVHFGLSD